MSTTRMAEILLVEDNEMNADMLSRRLRKHGHQVQVATDGESGLVQARAHVPDLIIMDMGLPVMDGWSATRALKADPALRAVPVIALTAHAVVGDRDRALQAGCDDYDTKPVDWPRLLAKIERLLAGG